MKRLLIFLLLSTLAFAQGSFIPPQTALRVVNGVTAPLSLATISVCPALAAGIPCAPANISIFKDAALTQPLSNPFTADAQGNYQFAVASGTFTVTVTGFGFGGYSYQITVGGTASNVATFSGTPTIGDCLLFSNASGSGVFDPSACPPHFIQVVTDPTAPFTTIGSAQQAQNIGTGSVVVISGTATETGGVTLTSTAVGSTNDVVDVDQGFGAAQGDTFNTYGPMRRYAVRIRLNNTTNVRYWWGLANLAPQFGTAAYSTNTPNTSYCMFRYSAGTDTTIKAACGTSNVSQTVVDTAVAVDTTASHLYEITNVGGLTTSFNFLIDGTVKATISTTLPTASTNYGTLAVGDNQNTATAIGFTFFYSTIVLK